METAMAGMMDWKATLLDPIGTLPLKHFISPSAITTVQYWRALLKKGPPLSGLTKLSIPIAFVLPDISVASGVDKGLTTVGDLYDCRRLSPFPDLQARYDLPHTDSFQLTHA